MANKKTLKRRNVYIETFAGGWTFRGTKEFSDYTWDTNEVICWSDRDLLVELSKFLGFDSKKVA